MTTGRPSAAAACRTAIPWYVHPAEDPDAWAALPLVEHLSMLVLNIADGPGQPDDPYYPAALERCGPLPWLGYVNLDYGRRPRTEVLADARAWRTRYGISGLFLDCVPGPIDLRARLTATVAALRGETDRLVGNPGQVADPGLVDAFDVTVVVENTWAHYRRLVLPAWHADVAPERLWHLVYACPPDRLAEAHRLAAQRPVGHLFVTDRTLPNPWRGLPRTGFLPRIRWGQ